jgi:hypothetical protein
VAAQPGGEEADEAVLMEMPGRSRPWTPQTPPCPRGRPPRPPPTTRRGSGPRNAQLPAASALPPTARMLAGARVAQRGTSRAARPARRGSLRSRAPRTDGASRPRGRRRRGQLRLALSRQGRRRSS